MRCFLCGPREESQCPVGYWSSSLCCGIVLEPQWLAGLSALETPGAMPVGALSTGGAT